MKDKLLVTLVLVIALSATVSAQGRKSPRGENIFAELWGPGLFTFNYDTRFSTKEGSWGGRIGIGYISIDEFSLFSIPVGINYLMGKENKYFELGLNGTFMSSGDNWLVDGSDNSTLVGSLVFGYRKQPIEGGFSFRAGISPYFSTDFFFPLVPYLSFGYAF